MASNASNPSSDRANRRPPRLRARASFGVAAALALVTGCAAILGLDETTQRADDDGGGDGGTGGFDAGPPDAPSTGDADAGSGPLSLAPATVLLRRGGTATFAVTLTRGPSTPASVTVTLTDLPAGVTAAPTTIGAGQTTANVTLTATADAALGPKVIRAVSAETAGEGDATATLLVAGAPGSADTTFDGDGVAIDATKGVASTFYALAVQPDGKIVAGGLVGGPGPVATGGWLLRRFLPDGKPDTAFDAATNALPVDGEIRALALDAQGRIVCVGTSSPGANGVPQLTVVRVAATGAVDSTFAGGVARVPALEAPSGSAGLAVSIDAAGNVYAGGTITDDGGEGGVVVRFGANGARDAAFNGGKIRTTPQSRIVGVAADGDGVTLGGTDTSAAVSTYWLARMRADGGVDPTFGTFGESTFAVSYRAHAFTRVPAGPLVLVGGTDPNGAEPYTAGLATPGGAQIFSRAFGTAAGAAFYAVAPVGNVGFVAAGHAAGPNGQAKVTRILLDGGADTSFSAGGNVVLDPAGAANGYDLTLFAAAVQADGRILVAGNRSGAGAVVHRLWQ